MAGINTAWSRMFLGTSPTTRHVAWGADKPSLVETYLVELERRTGTPFDRPAAFRAFTECEIVCVLWNLSWSVEACRDEASVNNLLRAIEVHWARLEKGTGHD